jgi:hypothetical protein
VPGFSLHQDLRALEQAGLGRFEVLSAATRLPGQLIATAKPGAKHFGTVTVGNTGPRVPLDCTDRGLHKRQRAPRRPLSTPHG